MCSRSSNMRNTSNSGDKGNEGGVCRVRNAGWLFLSLVTHVTGDIARTRTGPLFLFEAGIVWDGVIGKSMIPKSVPVSRKRCQLFPPFTLCPSLTHTHKSSGTSGT